jgi:hypothetical protein
MLFAVYADSARFAASQAAKVARVISRGWVQGPTLPHAVFAAARLRARLPTDIVLPLLRHAEPAIRADACRLARGGPDVVDTLIELLGDLHPDVALEEAVPPIADEECVVLLGRVARQHRPNWRPRRVMQRAAKLLDRLR